MNNSTDIVNKKKDILLKLSKRQIKDVIEELTKLAINLQDWHISENLNELDTNYKYMLHYQFERINDPQFDNMYNDIVRKLFELTDNITDELLMSTSSNVFYEKARINSIKPQVNLSDFKNQLKDVCDSIALTDLLDNGDQKQSELRKLSVKRERIAAEMFNMVFVSPRADDDSILQYRDFIDSIDIREREKCLFISALTLNLFHRFDNRKIKLLMDICTYEDKPVLSQRAVVGLIILLQMYDVRLAFYTDCKQQLESLSESPYFRKSVITVIKQLIRSRETEKISKRITDEIIPEMLRFNTLAGKKLNMDDLMGMTDDFSEKNPEWKKELENSGLADKLQEYSNLQMEGADVFHSTFSNLKSFPFFSEMSNWFLPFDTTYSELQSLFPDAESGSLLYKAILASGHMCDSDKYSFCFSLLQLPESQRNLMLQRFGAESEEMKQLQKEAMELNSSVNDEIISNQYIQNLYRFIKLYSLKNNFLDIFNLRINFYDKKSIAPFISELQDMKQVAIYCFDKNFFAEALHIYELITEKGEIDANIWQKIGYCRQMLNNQEGALQAYLQADLLSADNTWTLKRITQLYRSLKQPEKAIEYYKKLQTLTIDNISVELNIGHCYLDTGDYDKAVNAYFKVELLEGGDNSKAWRPIAWTSFLMKKFDVAQKYYQKIIADKPTVHDYLNAGHTELALNNKKIALDYYMNTVSALKGESIDEFIRLFMADKDELVKVGIDEKFFPVLFDELRYKLD